MTKRIMGLFLIAVMLCGCGNSEAVEESVGIEAVATMPDVSGVTEELVYDMVKTEKHCGRYEALDARAGMMIYRVTDEYIWFSFYKTNARLMMARAKKEDENTYCFTYGYDQKKDDNTCKAGGSKTGKITLLNYAVEIDIQGKTNESALGYKGKLPYKEGKKEYPVCDLLRCTDEYFSARTSIFKRDMTYIQIGKERGTNRVSYVEANPENAVLYNAALYERERDASLYCYGKEEEKRNYKMGDITFFSTREECDRQFGKPVKKTARESRYRYNESYEAVISFDGDCIISMGLYLENREKALQKYIVGDYTLQGCRIVKYNGGYNGTSLELPEDATGIAGKAFELEKSPDPTEWNKYNKNQDGTPVRKISVCIPRKIYMEPLAFYKTGPIEITFEEGREEIEPGAFYEAGKLGRYGTIVTFPESVTRIRQRAFENSILVEGTVQLKLNDGIKRIDSYALHGGANFGKFPKKLESLGNYSIYIERPREKLKIPKTLKKVGFNAISYGLEVEKGGVVVNSGNPYFKSDKNGWLYSRDGKKLYLAFAYKTTVQVPDSVESIECEPEDEMRNYIKLPDKLKW